MLDVEFAERTDVGRTREHNEDCIGHVVPASRQTHDDGWLFALADGVGGQEKGEVASRLAIDTVLAEFKTIPKGIMHVSLLPKLVQQANQAVFEAGNGQSDGLQDKPEKVDPSAHMASTLILCALRFDSAVISHVGDSRCYLLRSGRLTCLTHDHTIASEQSRLGLASDDEEDGSPNRHILTRSLGMDLFVAADTMTVAVLPGDVLMLCSDGLHGYVPDFVIQTELTSMSDLNGAAEALIARANEAGGHDNVSVQLIRVRSVERMGLYRGRPYRLL